jgi:hypothetical protein
MRQDNSCQFSHLIGQPAGSGRLSHLTCQHGCGWTEIICLPTYPARCTCWAGTRRETRRCVVGRCVFAAVRVGGAGAFVLRTRRRSSCSLSYGNDMFDETAGAVSCLIQSVSSHAGTDNYVETGHRPSAAEFRATRWRRLAPRPLGVLSDSDRCSQS